MRIYLLSFLILFATGIFAQGTGEVIITEIHNRPLKPTQEQLDAALPNNPAGADTTPNEGHTEWFEVYNTTSSPVVMDGWILEDASNGSSSVITNFTLAANAYAVFAGFNIPDGQGGVVFDYFYNYKQPSFNNESSYADPGDTNCPDGVILQTGNGTLVDQVLYDYGYGEYIGNPEASESCSGNAAPIGIPAMGSSSRVSFMLNFDPAIMNAADNDLAANWSFSTLTYDAAGGQLGTPGIPNDGAIGSGGTGEIIITEIHNRPLKPTQEQLDAALPNNPAGADTTPNEGHTEWFEIYNTTSSPVVMDGWIIGDASNGSSSVITNFTLAANAYAVFAGFNIPDGQGGVVFDYFYNYKQPSFNNESSYADTGDTNCPDGVILQTGNGTLVDQVLYDYGYGEYIGNPGASASCSGNAAPIGIPAMGSSSRVSFMLNFDPAIMNAADNDLADNWSFSTLTYDAAGGQLGTPGIQNDAGLSTGGTGEVIITEIHNRPLKPTQAQLDAALPNNLPGADTTPNEGHTEWFEIYNTTSSPVVMDGWVIGDASNGSSSVISSFTLAPNAYAVFTGFNIPDAQGDVVFDYFYNYKQPSFNNESSYADPGDTNCPDGVILQTGNGTLVDQVLYDYGYGEYIGNPGASESCSGNAAPISIPAMGSSSRTSFMLNCEPSIMNAADNDLAANWSYSTSVYDDNSDDEELGDQFGTPGEPNICAAFCEQSITLNPGWNLVSLDVSPVDKALNNLFNVPLAGNLEFVTSFDAGAKTFDPNIPLIFNSLKDVEDGFGYWVKVTNAATLIFDGTCLADGFRKPLDAGWNLIAYPPDAAQNTEVYFADLITANNLEFVTGFNEGTVTFNPNLPIPFNSLKMLENGFGYWVKVFDAVNGSN